MKGRILSGINNIYSVETEDKKYLCRIKGKILKHDVKFYNPIAAGDFVEFIPDEHSDRQGTITSLSERKNIVTRWNRKRMLPQILAANIDILGQYNITETSAVQAPFYRQGIYKLQL